jgi:hypothetical protein
MRKKHYNIVQRHALEAGQYDVLASVPYLFNKRTVYYCSFEFIHLFLPLHSFVFVVPACLMLPGIRGRILNVPGTSM